MPRFNPYLGIVVSTKVGIWGMSRLLRTTAASRGVVIRLEKKV